MSTERTTLTIGSLVIGPEDQTPLVLALVEMLGRLEAKNKALEDEIHKLKGKTQRPKIEPSRLLKSRKPRVKGPQDKRPGSAKRHKTADLTIHEEVGLTIEGLPEGTRVEGYRDFVVQDLRIAAHNTRYRRAVYRLLDGTLRVASRPDGIEGHFGAELKQFILSQSHQMHASQARLLEQLREFGIDISSGQLNSILLDGHDAFHAEKESKGDILLFWAWSPRSALAVARRIRPTRRCPLIRSLSVPNPSPYPFRTLREPAGHPPRVGV